MKNGRRLHQEKLLLNYKILPQILQKIVTPLIVFESYDTILVTLADLAGIFNFSWCSPKQLSLSALTLPDAAKEDNLELVSAPP